MFPRLVLKSMWQYFPAGFWYEALEGNIRK